LVVASPLTDFAQAKSETKKERKLMQKTSSKKGIALGAILALVAAVFGGTTPALATNAVNGDKVTLTPVQGSLDNFNGLVIEDFQMNAYLLPGITNTSFAAGTAYWEVTKVSGAYDIIISTASQTINPLVATSTTHKGDSGVTPATFSAFVDNEAATNSVKVGAGVASNLAPINIAAVTDSPGFVTWTSGPAVVTVKLWIENPATADGSWQATEWYVEKTVTLHKLQGLATTTFTQTTNYDTVLTVSATVPTLNYPNLNGGFRLGVIGGAGQFDAGASTVSPFVDKQTANTRSGVISYSITVSGSVSPGSSISAFVVYQTSEQQDLRASYTMSALANRQTGTVAVDTVSISSVANANVSGSATAYTVRQNELITVRVHASTTAGTVSVSGQTVVVNLAGGTALNTASNITMAINGGTPLTTLPTALTLTTGADGYASFTVKTTGFTNNNTIRVNARVGNVAATQTVYTVADPSYTVNDDFDYYVTSPGTATTINYTVTDQWGELSSRTDQYLKLTRGSSVNTFNYATTVSYLAVTGGKAAFAFTPEPAARTGSATVLASIVRLASGTYTADGSSSVTTTVNVPLTSSVDAFGTGLAASYSASVSYFPSTVSWTAVSANVANTGSAVVISGTDLIFRVSSAVDTTYSGAITLRAGAAGTYSFEVASLKAGTKTMSLVNGSATTTSLLVVDAAASDYGTTITFDTSAITAGTTKIITGTLTDMNGNPVDTTGAGSVGGDTGTASMTVTYQGDAGIVVGSVPTETDANGQFRLSVLTSAADSGTLTITATYNPQGAATVAAKKVTGVQPIAVGAASSSSSDKKVNAGSFKGYVAVYAKGYEGQRLSAKVGKDWVVVESLASNFERVVEFTGAGYTIAVRIYIDRVLVDTITVTTK